VVGVLIMNLGLSDPLIGSGFQIELEDDSEAGVDDQVVDELVVEVLLVQPNVEGVLELH